MSTLEIFDEGDYDLVEVDDAEDDLDDVLIREDAGINVESLA